jgi:hypothetical protein
MICILGNRQEHIDVYYDNTRLDVVSKFCYLGVTLSAKTFVREGFKNFVDIKFFIEAVPLGISEKL